MWSWLKKLFRKKEIVNIPKNPEKPPDLLDSPEKPEVVNVVQSTPLKPDFKHLWESMVVNDGLQKSIAINTAIILKSKSRYESVSIQTGLDWEFIAALHYRESSLDFQACLHNGDPLPGPTKNVPRGRGPFRSWEESAVDALKFDNILPVNDIESLLKAAESYNGLGYRKKGIYSPYLWAGTNHYSKGKYIGDGVYGDDAVDKQLGVAVILKELKSLP